MSREIAAGWSWRTRRKRAFFGLQLAASALLAGGCHSLDPAASPLPVDPPVRQKLSAVVEPEARDAVRAYAAGATKPESAKTVDSAVVQAAGEKKGDVQQAAGQKKSDEKPAIVQASAQRIVVKEAKGGPPASNPGAAVPAPEDEATIDLAAALRLAGVDSPTINLAREVVNEAVARWRGAQVLLLPTFTAGMNYHEHNGELQASSGIIRVLHEQSFYAGLGARTLAAESVAFPGIRVFSHLGDALYEPLAARQEVGVRRSDASATENQILLQVSTAYFNLVSAEVRVEVMRKGEAEIKDIARRTLTYAKAGQGRYGDANRAEARAELLRRQIQEAEGDVATASARLAALLNLDPAVRLKSPGGPVETIALIDETQSLEKLLDQAMSNRPEMRARLQAVAEARTRMRQEQVRPFLPTVSVGFSAGTFGGGSNLTASGITANGGNVNVTPFFGNFGGRTDLDVFAVWTLQNGAVGNRARVKGARAVMGEAVAMLEETRNEIRDQVSEALADAQAASRNVEVAQRELKVAQEGYAEELTRIKQTVGRPLETIDSFRQLNDARLQLLAAIIAFNSAQYRLFVAIGFSPLESPAANEPPKQAAPAPVETELLPVPEK